MKKITDEWLVADKIKQLSLEKRFDTEKYHFCIHTYEKEEFLVTPNRENSNILFLLEGEVKIYHLQKDGTMGTVGIACAGDVLGDFEFCRREHAYLFAEAITKVSCLVLSWMEYEDQLRADSDFLMFLLHVSIDKMANSAELVSINSSLEDKLLFYIQNMCVDQTMRNVNSASMTLHCSRRQLQRLLKRLCENHILEKTGRGHYQLIRS